jgi:hypothetical protein
VQHPEAFQATSRDIGISTRGHFVEGATRAAFEESADSCFHAGCQADADCTVWRYLIDIGIGGMVAGVPTYAEERILKAGCIAAGEELLGIGRITSSAKQRKLEVEQTVIAADRTVTASLAVTFVWNIDWPWWSMPS